MGQGGSRGRGIPEDGTFTRRGKSSWWLPLLLLANAAAAAPAANAAPARAPLTKKARDTWRACVLANYHEVPSNCDQCKPPSDCTCCYFCVPCKEGGLCDKKFNGGALHHNHDRLQVYKINGLLSVRKTDLPSILAVATEVTEFVSMWNMYYLRTRSPTISDPRIWCEGCKNFVSNSENAALLQQNVQAAKVCSIECLVKYDQGQHTFHHKRKQPHPKRSPLM